MGGLVVDTKYIAHVLQVVPFFFYRGLERLTYSWSDRALQALFTVLYTGRAVSMIPAPKPSGLLIVKLSSCCLLSELCSCVGPHCCVCHSS